ncbi:hypothetical protein [Nocardia lijiangensis]|uniref:hypothetical protein n=1 Tax=Nocardia lijiangensis TaxID=299618 RepID=UPI000A57443A|nr:hypothetical protein [Nocardia lijiangensis]
MTDGVRTIERARAAGSAPQRSVPPRGIDARMHRARAVLTAATPRAVILAACCLVVAQLVLRGWIAARGYFYWDDLVLVGRAGRYPLLSADLLLYDHDGHFMPLAFGTAWIVTRAAPLEWAGPVLSLLVLQLAASLAVLRMLIILAGRRRAILVPLVLYLVCPLTLPAFAWWSAALNAVPLQFALAWVVGDAVLLVRTGRRRYAVSGIVVLIVALLFFEKSVVVPFVAFAAAAATHHVDGHRGVVGVVARRGAPLWIGSGVVLVAWLGVYLSVVDVAAVHGGGRDVGELLHHATSLGVVPALSGGPWVWERWLPATPWAAPPGWAVAAAWVVLGVLAVLAVWMRRRVGAVLVAVAVYVVVAQLPLALIRSGPHTATEIMQSLRYLADVAVVMAAAGALVLRARPREPDPLGFPAAVGRRRFVAPVLAGLTVAFVASSLWSSWTFTRAWAVSPTRTYLGNVTSALGDQDAPLLEQEVPWEVLAPYAYPQNLADRVLAPVAPPAAFADSTPRLRMITDAGEIVDAVVWWNRHIRPGPDPGCDYRIAGLTPVELPLDGPTLDNNWTAQLNYVSDRDGHITVGLERGRPVVVPVEAGTHTVYVRVVGGGSSLRISSYTTGLALCVGVGPVGVASYDR